MLLNELFQFASKSSMLEDMNERDDDPHGTYYINSEQKREHARAQKETGFWGKQGAGCLMVARSTGRILIGLRSKEVNEPLTWGTIGGAIDTLEVIKTPEAAVRKEIGEEIGYRGHFDLVPLLVFQKRGFSYSNFLAIVDEEFEPKLDWETADTTWCEYGDWPKPLHPGMVALLNDPASLATLKKYAAEFSKNR